MKKYLSFLLFVFLCFSCSTRNKEGHDKDTVEENEETSIGGEPIDLGLSVLWASKNVGANNSTDMGEYFAWGETTENTNYDWNTYFDTDETSNYDPYGGVYTNFDVATRFKVFDNESKSIKGTQYDVAHVRWGGNWVMPSSDEFYELLTKCQLEMKIINNKTCVKVTGPNGNSIILPTTGEKSFGKTSHTDSECHYWTSNLKRVDREGVINAYYFYFDTHSKQLAIGWGWRCNGMCVRPVMAKDNLTYNEDDDSHNDNDVVTDDEASAMDAIAARNIAAEELLQKSIVDVHISAGELSNKLFEPAEIINLTLHGHMDARDFDYIKLHCSQISYLDISNVVIDRYVGTEGTAEGSNIEYSSNEIPLGAFFYWDKINYETYGFNSDEGMPSLYTVKLPNGIKAIRRNAFARAYNLTEINIPEGVTTIGFVAFAICKSLPRISLPSTLNVVESLAFADAMNLRNVYIAADVPPTAAADSFKGIPNDATLHVPSGTANAYRRATGWNVFCNIVEN